MKISLDLIFFLAVLLSVLAFTFIPPRHKRNSNQIDKLNIIIFCFEVFWSPPLLVRHFLFFEDISSVELEGEKNVADDEKPGNECVRVGRSSARITNWMGPVVPRQTQNLKRMEHVLSAAAEQLRHTHSVHDRLKAQVTVQYILTMFKCRLILTLESDVFQHVVNTRAVRKVDGRRKVIGRTTSRVYRALLSTNTQTPGSGSMGKI